MNTAKYLLFGALGVAAVLLLTSDKANNMRNDLEDKAKDNARKWKNLLGNVGTTSAGRLAELKKLLDSEVEGLSNDARKRIEAVVNGTTHTASKLKKDLNGHLA